MIICPNCLSSPISNNNMYCESCNWSVLNKKGVLDYLNKNDRKDQLAQDYSDNYENLAQINLKRSNVDRKFLLNQAKNLMKYIGPVRNKKICEIGVGQGFLCDELIKEGASSIAAVDVAFTYLKRFTDHKVVTPYLANAEYLPFVDEFDLIASTDVMEHVLNVGSYLYCVNRALKSNGLAAIRIPYREGLLAYSPHRDYPHKFGHLRSFNKDVLKIYFKQAGFKIEAMHLDGFLTTIPQPFLYDKQWKKNLYHKIQPYLEKHLDHLADATFFNPIWAKLIMRPIEVVVIARKILDAKITNL